MVLKQENFPIEIRTMEKSDWISVSSIYAEGIATGIATFEHSVPTYAHWHNNHSKVCRLVAVNQGQVLGWAALSNVSKREVYSGVAEVSIYMAKKARGKGVGKKLLSALIAASEQEGFWTLQSRIFPENTHSIALHNKLGFRLVGKQIHLGKNHLGRWKDNLLFEKRSKTVGV